MLGTVIEFLALALWIASMPGCKNMAGQTKRSHPSTVGGIFFAARLIRGRRDNFTFAYTRTDVTLLQICLTRCSCMLGYTESEHGVADQWSGWGAGVRPTADVAHHGHARLLLLALLDAL